MVRLNALGQSSIESGDFRIGPEHHHLFAVALYLVLERGKRISRQSIVELVWPEVESEQRARQRLRQTLLRLREMGLPITNQGDSVVLAKSGVEADFETLTGVDPTPLVNGSRSSLEFLPDYCPRLSDRFLDWVEQQRSRVHSGVQRLFVARIQQSRLRGHWNEVDALADECLRLDPYNEEAVMARAESAVMRGSKREALAILDRYMDALGPKVEAIGLPAKILRSRIAERLTEPRYALLSEKHFVGRESSMELLNGLFRDARKGMGSGAFIWGPPGIGKSRLVQEMVNSGTLQGARVVSTKCQPSDVGRPLSAFADLVPPLRTLPGALGCSAQTVALLQRLTERDKTEVSSPVEPGDAEFLAATIRRAIFDLVDAVADEGMLIMVVEDVHWLDTTSWSILRAIVEWSTTKKLLVLMTSRAAHATQEKVADPDRGLHRHALQPLGDTDADSLLQLLAEGQDNALPEAVRSWSISAAEGNPYFLRELVTHWVETRQTFGVPRSLAALIEARLDRLSSLALRVLQFCAALGKHSTFDRLERVTGYQNHSLLDAIEELSVASLLLASEGHDIRPKHDLLATAALARLGGAAKKLVHRQVATVLEAEINEQHTPALMWDCAEHWHLAGQHLYASSTIRACAAYFLTVGAVTEAIALQERAIELAATPNERRSALIGLANSLKATGEWPRVAQIVVECLGIDAGNERNRQTRDDLRLLSIEAAWRLGRPLTDYFGDAVELVQEEDASPIHRARAARLALIFCALNGLRDDARMIHTAIAPRLDAIQDAAVAAQIEMIFHTDFGDLDVGVEYARALLLLGHEEGDAAASARTKANCAVCFRRAGLVAEAKELLEQSFTFAASHEMTAGAAFAAHTGAALAFQEENFAEVSRWLDRGEPWFVREQELISGQTNPYFRTILAIEKGDLETARESVSHVSWIACDAAGIRSRQSCAALHLHYQLFSDQAPDPATLERLEQDFKILSDMGQSDFAALVLARALLAADRSRDARETLKEYLEHRRRDRAPLPPRLISLATQLGVLAQG